MNSPEESFQFPWPGSGEQNKTPQGDATESRDTSDLTTPHLKKVEAERERHARELQVQEEIETKRRQFEERGKEYIARKRIKIPGAIGLRVWFTEGIIMDREGYLAEAETEKKREIAILSQLEAQSKAQSKEKIIELEDLNREIKGLRKEMAEVGDEVKIDEILEGIEYYEKKKDEITLASERLENEIILTENKSEDLSVNVREWEGKLAESKADLRLLHSSNWNDPELRATIGEMINIEPESFTRESSWDEEEKIYTVTEEKKEEEEKTEAEIIELIHKWSWDEEKKIDTVTISWGEKEFTLEFRGELVDYISTSPGNDKGKTEQTLYLDDWVDNWVEYLIEELGSELKPEGKKVLRSSLKKLLKETILPAVVKNGKEREVAAAAAEAEKRKAAEAAEAEKRKAAEKEKIDKEQKEKELKAEEIRKKEEEGRAEKQKLEEEKKKQHEELVELEAEEQRSEEEEKKKQETTNISEIDNELEKTSTEKFNEQDEWVVDLDNEFIEQLRPVKPESQKAEIALKHFDEKILIAEEILERVEGSKQTEVGGKVLGSVLTAFRDWHDSFNTILEEKGIQACRELIAEKWISPMFYLFYQGVPLAYYKNRDSRIKTDVDDAITLTFNSIPKLFRSVLNEAFNLDLVTPKIGSHISEHKGAKVLNVGHTPDQELDRTIIEVHRPGLKGPGVNIPPQVDILVGV